MKVVIHIPIPDAEALCVLSFGRPITAQIVFRVWYISKELRAHCTPVLFVFPFLCVRREEGEEKEGVTVW